MRVIVAGSRGITDPNVVATAIAASGFQVTELVSGTARGADQLGEAWALCRYRHKAHYAESGIMLNPWSESSYIPTRERLRELIGSA